MHNVIMKLPYREEPQCGVMCYFKGNLGSLRSSLYYTNIIMIKMSFVQCVLYLKLLMSECSPRYKGHSARSSRNVLFHKREHVLTFEHNWPFRISNHALIAQSPNNIYDFFFYFFYFYSIVFIHKAKELLQYKKKHLLHLLALTTSECCS